MDENDRIDAMESAVMLEWALDDRAYDEARLHFEQVARSMGYSVKRLPQAFSTGFPSVAQGVD
jgi:hypothetical protein